MKLAKLRVGRDTTKSIFEIIVVGLAIFINLNYIYLLFLYEVINMLKKEKVSLSSSLEIAILSIMLPDNYTSIALTLLFGAFGVFTRRKFTKDFSFFVMFFIVVLSSIISFVPVINLLFSLLYFAPAILLMILLNNKIYLNFSQINDIVKNLVFIELVATLFNLIKAFSNGWLGVYSDWSIGTFGNAQTAQFCIFSYFIMALNFYWYKQNEVNLSNTIIWALIAISTNCWSMTAIAAVFAFAFYLPSLNIKHLKIVIVVIPVGLVALLMSRYYMPELIWNQIIRMFDDADFRMYRFAKLQTYIDTFITIPSKDIKFLLLGNGLGYYDSRAALTCTGHYVSSYLNMFSESMSEYTRQYVYPQLTNAFFHGETDYGSVLYRPYSSVIALMGETGVLGLITSATIYGKLLKKKTRYSIVLLGVFMGICFLENYLEYAKIVLLMYFLISLFECKEDVLNGVGA